MGDQQQLDAWIIGAVGPDSVRRFAAPVAVPEWDSPPWVELRPLTSPECLQRESLGLYDEYHFDANGGIERVVRRYDVAAMIRYDLEHCVVDFCLPRQSETGQPIAWHKSEQSTEQLLDKLPPALAEWLRDALDEVNLRRLADQELLGAVKKS